MTMEPITPILRADRMKRDQQEALQIVTEIGEALTARDWDGIEELTMRLEQLAGDIAHDNHNLVLQQYCAPRES